MKRDNFTSKILTFLFCSIFVFVACMQEASAKFNSGLFWGITANFDSNSFDGTIVIDDDGKYDEGYHSFSHATVTFTDNLKLGLNISDLRCNQGSGTNTYFTGGTISDWCAYNMAGVQYAKWSDNGLYANHWFASPRDSEVRGDAAGCVNGSNISIDGKGLNEDLYGQILSNELGASPWRDLTGIQRMFLKWSGEANSYCFIGVACKNWTGASGWAVVSNYDFAITDRNDEITGLAGVNGCKARKDNSQYTWPGIEDGGDVGAEDEAMLNWVNGTIITEYNEALGFILNAAKVNNLDTSTTEDKMKFLDFAAIVASAERYAGTKGSSTVKINIIGELEVNFKMDVVKNNTPEAKNVDMSEMGSQYSDFVKITILDDKLSPTNNTLITRWCVPKGYAKGQRLEGFIESRTGTDIKTMTTHITTEHVAYQAMFNYYMAGQTSLSASDFYSQQGDWLERIVFDLVNNILNGLTNMLNLYSLEDLCLNTGVRGIRYWQGVMPSTWFNATQYFYLFTFSLSMIMLIISLVKLAFNKSLSSIGNIARRVSLIEGIKRIIIASIAVIFFSSIFIMLCQLNFSLVTAVSGLVDGEILFNADALANGTIAGVLIAFIFFFISLKMNFTYMLRGITILICYLLGPMCIMASAMGERFSLITQNWIKELLGNIFIQTIHAFIMMLFISISRYGSQTSIEKMVLVYSFIPLTEFIRTNLFALGKGLDDVADNLASTTGGLAVAGLAAGASVATQGVAKITGAGLSKIGNSQKFSNSFVGKAANKIGSLGGGKVGAAFKGLAHATPNALGHMASAGMMSMGGIASGASNAQGRSNGALTFGAIREGAAAVDNWVNAGYRAADAWEAGAPMREAQADNAITLGDNSGIGVRTDANGDQFTQCENADLAKSAQRHPNSSTITNIERVDNKGGQPLVKTTLNIPFSDKKNSKILGNFYDNYDKGNYSPAAQKVLSDKNFEIKKNKTGYTVSYNRKVNRVVNAGGGKTRIYDNAFGTDKSTVLKNAMSDINSTIKFCENSNKHNNIVK